MNAHVADIVMETLLHEIASMLLKRIIGRGKYLVYDRWSEAGRRRIYGGVLKTVAAFFTTLLTLRAGKGVLAAAAGALQHTSGLSRDTRRRLSADICGFATHRLTRR